ncbi:hypothetical protein V8F06_003010 [Rhypophila decipiens]
MDPRYSARGMEDVYSQNPNRSRASSSTSTTEALFHSLHIAESPPHITPFETATYPGSGRISPARYLSTPTPHNQPAYRPDLDQEWFDTERRQIQGTPLLRVEPAPDQLETPASSPPLRSVESETMSTVALHYDPGFNMGSRSSFTWPVLESGSGLLGSDLGHYGSETSLTPPTISRSVTASPPRGSLTPEQRELKRQQDHARRDSKLHARGSRAGSNSSSVYSPPVTMADLTTGASSMPIYTTAPAQMSLLSEPPTTQYLPSFSPPIPDHSQSNMYTSYPPPSYMTDYYPSTTAASLPSHYGRPLAADSNLSLYPVSSIMGQSHQDTSGQVRVVHSRPKPQCWEHGCNGRQFSTFSNLLRHQREKSGQATKATCPECGAEFTRTTARNGHLMHGKCKTKLAQQQGSAGSSVKADSPEKDKDSLGGGAYDQQQQPLGYDY